MGESAGPQAGFLRAFLLLVVLGSCSPLYALDPSRAVSQYRVEGWTSSEGLPQNSIQALLQSQSGYILAGTQEGIARFDGARFTVWNALNTPELHSNDIRALLEDPDGSLWVGTNGKGLLHRTEKGWAHFGLEEGLAGLAVFELARDREGTLWVGTESGLTSIRGRELRSYHTSEGLPSEFVTKICAVDDGTLWVGTEGGLAQFSQGKLQPVALPQTLRDHSVLALWWDPMEKELWVGTRGGAVHGLPGEFRPLALTYEGDSLECWSFFRDREKSFWVGTSNGLFRIRGERRERIGTGEGLLYPVISALFEDQEGSLWVGTQSGGLNRLKDGAFTTYGSAQGLSGEFVWTVFEDHAGGVWVGTDRSGLHFLVQGHFRHFGPQEGLTAFEVTAIGEDSAGTLWVGGRNGIFRKVGERFVEEPRETGPRGRIRAILGTPDGDLWVATHGNGLFLKRGNAPFRQFTVADGLPTLFVRCLLMDHQGRLWVGTSGAGLSVLAGTRFVRPEGSEDLNAFFILSITEDSQGGLWICTSEDGLAHFSEGRFTVFDRRAGLPDGALYIAIEDAGGFLWISSNRGICRVRRSALEASAGDAPRLVEVQQFGIADGMASSECNGGNQPAGTRTRDGLLWFPTMKGVVVTDPLRMSTNKVIPPVVVEEVLADGAEHWPVAGVYAIPLKTRNLEIHYTALSLLFPERVRFRYRLVGYDTAWVEAGFRRTAYYTGLPPGDFTFKLIACNSDGVWNEAGASVRVHIAPSLYQRRTVQVGAVLLFSAALFGWFRWRVRRLRLRQAELEALVQDRTANLTVLNEQLTLLARTDALTGLANYRIFYEHLREEWRRCARQRVSLAVIVVDVDNFKQFNDCRGHLEGDKCLREIAQALSGGLHRPGDFAARYGGEEFAVILSESTLEGATHVAEQLRERVEALAIPHPALGPAARVTISIGVATAIPKAAQDPEGLLGKADAALYKAKAAGRNRVVAEEPVL